MMRRATRWTGRLWAVLAVMAAGVPMAARAQSMADMQKSADISVWGGYTYQKPDYGPQSNSGGSFGVDVTRYLRLPVAPAFEARVFDTHGQTVNELGALFGLRVSGKYRRFHPYGDLLIGAMEVKYAAPPYPGDNSDRGLDIAGGGGVTYDIARGFAAKGDFLYQHVNFGATSEGGFTLTPAAVTIGVEYTIPFRPRIR